MSSRKQNLNESWSLCVSLVFHAFAFLLLFYRSNKETPLLAETHVDVTIVNIPVQSSSGQKNIAHPSTLAGGTLVIAMIVYKCWNEKERPYYVDGTLNITADNLEQLYRTCDTAAKIVKEGLF